MKNNYYKEVSEKLKMLQISNNAISEPIINAMKPYIDFRDNTSNNDLIYSGTVFNEIRDTLINELTDDVNIIPTIPLKYVEELKELSKLAKKYDYIMVIDNPME